jgi:hypothetical protein
MNKLVGNKDKSELAHRLAIELEIKLDLYKMTLNATVNDEKDIIKLKDIFKVPEYIEQAIKWVIQDSNHV